MTVNDLIRALSDLNHLDRELEVDGVEFVRVAQDGHRYVLLSDAVLLDEDARCAIYDDGYADGLADAV